MLSPSRPAFFASPPRHPMPPPRQQYGYHPQIVRPPVQQYPQRYPQAVPVQHVAPLAQQRFVPLQAQPQYLSHPPQFVPQIPYPHHSQLLIQSRGVPHQFPASVASPQRMVFKPPTQMASPVRTQPQQAPPQPQAQKPAEASKKDEDIEKRFEQALERTKKLVEANQPVPPQPKQPEPSVENADTHKSEEEPELEELALQYEDGYIYRGQGYQPQTRSGFGILTDQNENEVYAGFWKNNLYHGQGKLNNIEQEPRDEPVDWEDMTSIGNAWASYDGEFNEGKMHGSGTLTLSNGEKYNGEFQDGMFHGEGEFTTKTGEVVQGEWEQGVLTKKL